MQQICTMNWRMMEMITGALGTRRGPRGPNDKINLALAITNLAGR